MRSISITFFFTCLISIFSFCQDKKLKFTQGPLFDHDFKSYNKVVPQMEYKNYNLSIRDFYNLEYYDESRKKVANCDLYTKQLKKGYWLMSVINSEDKVFGIYRLTKKRESQEIVFKQEFALKTLKAVRSPIEITRNEIPKGVTWEKKANELFRSKRGSKFAITNYVTNSLADNHMMAVKTFDSDCKEIASVNIEYDFIEKLSKRIFLELDEQGNLFELRKIFKSKKELGKEENFEMKLYKIDLLGNLSSYSFLKNDFWKDDMKIVISEDKIYLAGLYDNIDEEKIRSVGVYHVVLEKNSMNLVAKSKKDYTISFLTTNYTDDFQEKAANRFNDTKKSNMGDLRFVDLQVNDKGELIVLSEIYYLKSSSQSDRITSNALDLILTKFSEDGEHSWSNIYKKRHQSVQDHFMGSVMMLNGNQAALFFNDHIANSSRFGVGQLENYTLKEHACVGVFIVNLENGDYTKESLQISENESSYMHPGATANDGVDGMLLYMTDRNKASFMRVQFK